MVATVQAPNPHSPTPPLSRAHTSSRRPWSPDKNAHLIFDWVKMQGKTQAEVASLLDIHQGTVSRLIQRYERWLAHLESREDGRLDPQERLRAQRQLTYDRNELLLASCLRIARDMEGSLDSSRSTISRPTSSFSQESEISTTHFTIDRTGTVCRFLRLAFRINMEQDKLAALLSREGETPVEPLSDEELAEQDQQAALDAAELANSKALNSSLAGTKPGPGEPPTTPASPPDSPEPVGWDKVAPATDGPPSPLNPEPETLNSASPPTHHSLTHRSPAAAHNAHHANPLQIAAITSQPCTCVVQLDAEKISIARIVEPNPPQQTCDEPPNFTPCAAALLDELNTSSPGSPW